jgi:hypothetical protein
LWQHGCRRLAPRGAPSNLRMELPRPRFLWRAAITGATIHAVFDREKARRALVRIGRRHGGMRVVCDTDLIIPAGHCVEVVGVPSKRIDTAVWAPMAAARRRGVPLSALSTLITPEPVPWESSGPGLSALLTLFFLRPFARGGVVCSWRPRGGSCSTCLHRDSFTSQQQHHSKL